MKIIVLSGSPKAEKSVTLQSVKYIEHHYPEHYFEYVHIARNIKKYEANEEELKLLGQKIQDSDGVIWAFPVYYTTVPSTYKRFIELVSEKCHSCFKDKYTAVFSTSIHYADNIAHDFMRATCEDLNMKYTDYLSHDMHDLLQSKMQQNLKDFFANFITSIKEGLKVSRMFAPLKNNDFTYQGEAVAEKITTEKQVIIITDALDSDYNLLEMINTYSSCFGQPPEVINLNDLDIKGPCLGCCRCAANNICAYHDQDGYREFLDYVIVKADIIIYAGAIRGRHLSALFKLYYDRSFCYTHIPFLTGKHLGYMISGNLSDNQTLRQSLEMFNRGNINLIGFVSDESQDSSEIDRQIYSLARKGVVFAEKNYFKPDDFIGLSSEKLFADAIRGSLGGIFTADYRYYRKNGLLTKVSWGEKLQGALMRYLMGRKAFRKAVQKNMINHMISGHKKVLSSLKGEE